MTKIAISCLILATILFVTGCMTGLTHGYESDGEFLITASYVAAAIGVVLLVIRFATAKGE